MRRETVEEATIRIDQSVEAEYERSRMPRANQINDASHDDDNDDVPEGFTIPEVGSAVETGADEPHEGWSTSDDNDDDDDDVESLAGLKINKERSANDREMLSAPTGEYTKVGRKPWVYKKDFIATDKAKGDFSKKGRLFLTFSGPIQNDDWKGIISFRISPDRRNGIDYQTKKVDTNKFDGMYRLWLQAEEYYLLQTGEEAASVLDIAELLSKDDELVFRVAKGRDIGSGSFVMGFKKQG